jgi:BirA family transcriptional regulator, biotin operon repressor / biotin---[acetyl-CoA-carboxylase] ligase
MNPRIASPDLERASDAIAARGCRLGRPLRVLAETGSTNDDARAGAREGAPHGALWIAETQSQGRGRQGRSWVSPRGENLLFSLLLRMPVMGVVVPARVPSVALVAGLAVRDAVAKAIGDDTCVLVKWPNDVVVRRPGERSFRKIAGVLCETSLMGSKVEHVVVGIGINVHTRAFPDEVASIATSIALETDRTPDRAEVLADVLASLDHDVEHVVHRGLGLVHARLTARDALLGATVDAGESGLYGVACGIDPDGCLLVRRSDGVVTKVQSGEVRLVVT